MITVAFTDGSGGYYETMVTDENDVPAWAVGMTRTDIVPPPTPPLAPLQQRIDNFVEAQTQGQIRNELQLEGLMAGLLGVHLASGGTEPDLELRNSAYRMGKQLRAAVAAMRAIG